MKNALNTNTFKNEIIAKIDLDLKKTTKKLKISSLFNLFFVFTIMILNIAILFLSLWALIIILIAIGEKINETIPPVMIIFAILVSSFTILMFVFSILIIIYSIRSKRNKYLNLSNAYQFLLLQINLNKEEIDIDKVIQEIKNINVDEENKASISWFRLIRNVLIGETNEYKK